MSLANINKAYNPYCAFNPYSPCPIPPKQNTLSDFGDHTKANPPRRTFRSVRDLN
jgi:hypothetical protein